MDIHLPPQWQTLLTAEFEQPYFAKLSDFIDQEYQQHTCYPPQADIFAAFRHCPLEHLKVVIIGQDPYHGPQQAEGLAFSVKDNIPWPPSLRNILKEVSQDLQRPLPQSGSLRRWAQQGILLLNTTLTVRQHQPASHIGQGWETFTDAVIHLLATQCQHLVFLLWGSHAQQKAKDIDPHRHLLLTAPHPSPLSAYRGFFGQHHFSTTNQYLRQHGKQPIEW